jgi:hypothetical protein
MKRKHIPQRELCKQRNENEELEKDIREAGTNWPSAIA